MKLILILTILLSSLKCSQNNTLLKIEYKAATRGASKYILITKNEGSYAILNSTSTFITKKEDWDTLINLVNKLDVQQIGNLKRPTTNSYSDAAMSATVIFTFSDKVLESSSFDDGSPPDELKEIINKLITMISE